MSIGAIDRSRRNAARVAGFAYLVSFAILAFGEFSIQPRLIVPGNAAETARRIIAHERLFRINIICDLLYCAGTVVLLVALFAILKSVNQNLALLAAFFRLAYALVWLLITINLFTALRLLNSAGYLQVFGADRLQAMARPYLSGFDAYYVGLLFYGLASAVCGRLWFKSHYIPRLLAAWGVISSAWCVMCTLVFMIEPNFIRVVNLWWFDTPMGIFDIVTSFWLLFKGLNAESLQAPK